MDSQKFCLKWNNYQSSVSTVFENLRQDEELVDITLCCEGHKIKAHRMMLSACSPYFRELLKENPCQHPVFFLKDTSYPDLAAVVEFVYKGEVNVAQSQLGSFLKTAEMLQVRGLTGDDDEEPPPQTQPQTPKPATPRGPGRPAVSTALPHLNSGASGRPRPASPPLKRRRVSTSPDRSGAAPPPSAAPVAPALAPAVSLPASLPPPPAPLPMPLSLPLSSALPLPPPASAGVASSVSTMQSEMPERTSAASERAGAEPPESPANDEQRATQHPPPPPPPTSLPQQRDYNIKVEKVDLPDEDDESLEATFSHVSNFEASQFEGSDHSAGSHDMAGLLSRVSEQGMGDMSAMAGPSEDGSSQGLRRSLPLVPGTPRYTCDLCGKVLRSEASLSNHRSIHRGSTRCQLCGGVYSTISALRRHVRMSHPGMAPPPTRLSEPAPAAGRPWTAQPAVGASAGSDTQDSGD